MIASTGRLWSCTHAQQTVSSEDSTARSSSGSKTSSLNINSGEIQDKSREFEGDQRKVGENRTISIRNNDFARLGMQHNVNTCVMILSGI